MNRERGVDEEGIFIIGQSLGHVLRLAQVGMNVDSKAHLRVLMSMQDKS